MKVTVHNFRCYGDRTFSFDKNNIYLLDGKSGVGKSTVFQAITWCLYGTYRCTSPHEAPNAKMWVQVELDNTTIYRQRNTGLLTITTPDGVFSSVVAQGIIDNKFGTFEVWMAATYMEQGCFNPLLEGPAQGKMDLLNSIAFLSDNPSSYINKIGEEVKKLEVELGVVQRTLGTDITNFNTMFAANNIDFANYRTPERMMELRREVTEKEGRLGYIRDQQNKLSMLTGQRDTLERQMVSLEGVLGGIPVVTQTDVDSRVARHQKYLLYSKAKERYDSAVVSFNRVRMADPPGVIYTEKDYADTLRNEQLYVNGESEARKNGVGYNIGEIEREVAKVESLLSYQPKMEANDRRAMVITQLESVKSRVTSPTTQAVVDGLKVTAHQMTQSKTVFPCPHCGGRLRSIPGGAQVAQEDPFNQKEYDGILAKIREGEGMLSLQREVERLERELSSLVCYPIPDGIQRVPVSILSQKVYALRSIRVVPKPSPSSVTIRCAINHYNGKVGVDREEDNMKRVEVVDPVDLARLDGDRNNLARRITIEQQLAGIKSSYSSLPTPTTTLSQLTQESDAITHQLVNVRKEIDVAVITNNVAERHRDLEERRGRVNNLHDQYTTLLRLQQVAIALEYKRLEEVVGSINIFIGSEAPRLFKDNISVVFTLSKTIKSTGVDKHQVGLHIWYRKGELSDIKPLSGGEKERINLLVTLAVNRVWGNKLLIFDESLVNLDEKNRRDCYDLIRKVVFGEDPDEIQQIQRPPSNSIVLVVSHGKDGEGLYDQLMFFT